VGIFDGFAEADQEEDLSANPVSALDLREAKHMVSERTKRRAHS
jgi:hypothetical protein